MLAVVHPCQNLRASAQTCSLVSVPKCVHFGRGYCREGSHNRDMGVIMERGDAFAPGSQRNASRGHLKLEAGFYVGSGAGGHYSNSQSSKWFTLFIIEAISNSE